MCQLVRQTAVVAKRGSGVTRKTHLWEKKEPPFDLGVPVDRGGVFLYKQFH